MCVRGVVAPQDGAPLHFPHASGILSQPKRHEEAPHKQHYHHRRLSHAGRLSRARTVIYGYILAFRNFFIIS